MPFVRLSTHLIALLATMFILFPSILSLCLLNTVQARAWSPSWPGSWSQGSQWGGHHGEKQPYKHVIAISIDGLHGSDVGKYVSLRPGSTIAQLLETGIEFTDAYTSGPSDSFPGTMNFVTGAHPRTTGVWYDDTYDRTFYPPGSNCSGPPGAEVVYDESKDYNSSLLFSGGIDPANLPCKIVNGECTAIYPHARIRVNTVYEVVVAQGLQTAYTDKHPSYDIVRGPSGTGLTSGYFPEIAAVPTEVDATIGYDKLHVQAWLDWIDGQNPEHAEGGVTTFPALMGGNFQAVSVAQKAVTGGYNADLSFSASLLKAIDFVDASLGELVAKLKAKGVYDDTLIIVASKHGQAPINPALFNEVDPNFLQNSTGVDVDFLTADDIGLFFLASHDDTDTAVHNLLAKKAELKIQDLIYGQQLIDEGYGNPLTDPAVPDIIVRPELGTIYTTSTKKIAEHGGLSDDDRHVACFVSSARLRKHQVSKRVSTREVAPTLLEALGLDAKKLDGVRIESTKSLWESCEW